MSGEPANVRTQNLRDFTVQIRRPGDDVIVGTGIVVSADGKVVTCAHVVEQALGMHPRDVGDAEVGVYFPQARGGEDKARRATVAACFDRYDDDVAVLQLVDGPAPLGREQIAVLGAAEPSRGHPFRSYGYRRLDKYIAGRAEGKILGDVERPAGRSVQADPVQLESSEINQGMSGAGVLDIERNLVVGIVAETWFPDLSTKDRDTAWAVNARVLTFDPLSLPLQDAPLPKRAAPQPRTDEAAARLAVGAELGVKLNNAPAPLPEWVGRAELLKSINADWAAPDCHVTGLIGFGGEGKSSLARRWLDDLLADDSKSRPDGVFWWGFYEKRSVDEFFEAALEYMSAGQADPRDYPTADAKAHFIAASFYRGRYLFVLDGLEVMQHQEGDAYGLLTSDDLRDFLSYFAGPGHRSFCLATSRAPVLDLLAYTTYSHRDVTRLSPANGRALLERVGVKGEESALDRVVTDWDGHALTLGLLGGYLVHRHGGDLSHIDQIPPPTDDEPRYDRVHRVLRRYDGHLTEAERAFLTLFAAFRTPVEAAAFDRVFRADTGAEALNAPVAALDDAAFEAMVKRLLDHRILRHDPQADHYTAHPLIRAHYLARLTAGDRSQTADAHERIKDYYLDLAGDTVLYPTLDELAPLIEVVHHACRAGAYDEAHRIRDERIYQGHRKVLIHQLGAFEAALALILEFFPDGDTSLDPQVSEPKDKGWILNTLGFCLMNLGRLREAAPFYERSNAVKLDGEDWRGANIGYQNLAELHVHLGALPESADAADEALRLGRRAEDNGRERDSLTRQAWTAHLRGDLPAAGATFREAEVLGGETDSDTRYLYGLRGVQHADHLRQAGVAAQARRLTDANLEICERNRWAASTSRCRRVLGDLAADASQHGAAREHYEEALKIARSISVRHVLIEALLSRGRWIARYVRDAPAALSDLNEALAYAVDGGYRIYEADVRVGLAWANLAAGDPKAGRQEAERARQMSVQMGYHWGQVDADEALAALE